MGAIAEDATGPSFGMLGGGNDGRASLPLRVAREGGWTMHARRALLQRTHGGFSAPIHFI